MKVPTRLMLMTFWKSSSGSGPRLPTTRPGVPTPAQLTAIAQRPELARCVDRRLHLGLVAHVGGHEARAVAELCGQLRAGGGGQVEDDHGRSRLVQSAGRGTAEAGGAPGDERDGVLVDLQGDSLRLGAQPRSSWRLMTSRWIWLVPSKIWVTLASRM